MLAHARVLIGLLVTFLVVGGFSQLNENVECPFIPTQSYDILQNVREAQNYDRYVTKANYLPFRPPFNPPCPGAPYEPQYTPSGDLSVLSPYVGPTTEYKSNIIPWRVGQLSMNNGTFGNGLLVSDKAYRKLKGIAFSLTRPAGLDFNTIAPNSDRLTIFAKDFDFRGPQNELKRKYMFALRPSLFELYRPKVVELWSDIRAEVEAGAPLISTAQNKTVKFFLSIHIGNITHPQFVFDYFLKFLPLAGLVRNRNVDLTKLALELESSQQAVYAYFEQRVQAIALNPDNTTFVHHWNIAGLPLASLVTECLHNIIAFVQFDNTLTLAIADKVWATNPPVAPTFYHPNPPIPSILAPTTPGAASVNFFEKYALAANDTQKLNVIREMFRLLAPNSAGFSKIEFPGGIPPVLEDTHAQSRHVWTFLSSLHYPLYGPIAVPPEFQRLAKYFTYDENKYPDHQTTHDGYLSGPVADPSILTPDTAFSFDVSDNNPTHGDGTVIFNEDLKLIPVYPDNRFIVFGMNYRACPGVGFSFFIADIMLDTFKDMTWKYEEPIGGPCNPADPDVTRHFSVAPRSLPFDNLYAIPSMIP